MVNTKVLSTLSPESAFNGATSIIIIATLEIITAAIADNNPYFIAQIIGVRFSFGTCLGIVVGIISLLLPSSVTRKPAKIF